MKNKNRVIGNATLLIIATITLTAGIGAATAPQTNTTTTTLSDGTTTYIVTINGGDIGTDADSPNAIRDHLRESRSDAISFLEETTGVTIETKYWIANEVKIKANTSIVSPSDLTTHPEITAVTVDSTITPPPQPEQPDGLATTQSTENSDTTYGLDQINAPEAWEKFNATGQGVNITIIDTGVDTSHPDITLNDGDSTNNYKGGWAIYNKSTTNDSTSLQPEGTSAPAPFDSDTGLYAGGHGTHVSGTATGGDATGTHIGVAPNATLKHVAVFDDYPLGYGAKSSDTISAIQWAVQNDADVISLSLGGSAPEPSYINAINNARNQGVIVIAASGNSGDGNTVAPADINNATGIGATDSTLDVPSFSGGERYDPTDKYPTAGTDWADPQILPFVVAPGDNVESAEKGSTDLTAKSGTSMAAPHAAGVAGLLLEQNPSLTPTQIELVLQKTAYEPASYSGRDTRYGYGIINATNALEATDPNGYVSIVNSSAPDVGTPETNVTVSANITNENLIGDTATRNVTLSRNGSVIGFQEVTLGSTATADIEFEDNITETDSDLGTKRYTLTTANETVEYNVTVADEKARFNTSFETSAINKTLATDWDETISINVTNVGGIANSASVDLYANGSHVTAGTTPTLEPGSSHLLNVTYKPTDEYTPVKLKANSSTDNTTLTRPVKTLPTINISATVSSDVDQGETVWLNATYNVSDGINRTITPIIERGDTEVYSGSQTTLSTLTNNSTVINATESLPIDITGGVTYNFTTANEYSTTENSTKVITVAEQAAFHVDRRIGSYDDKHIETTITNDGALKGTKEVRVTQNGTVVGSETITLAPGESKELTLGFDLIQSGPSRFYIETNTSKLGGGIETVNKNTGTKNPGETDEREDDDDSGGGGGGGGGQGGGSGGGGAPVDTGPPEPKDIKNRLSYAEPQEGGTVSNPTSPSSDTDLAGETNGVAAVTLSDGSNNQITVENYGNPSGVFEEDIVDSIANYNPEVSPATTNTEESTTGASQSSSATEDGASDSSETPPTSTQSSSGSEIDVVSISNIEPKQNIYNADTTATVSLTVNKDDISNPENLAVYKQEYIFEAQQEKWIKLDDPEIEETEESVTLTTEVTRFSLFAAVEYQDRETNTTPTTNGTTSNDTTDDSTPGFTLMTAIVAIIGILLAIKRRTTR